VVKTIGDAVMATFSRVDEALGAVRQMHQKIPAVNQSGGAPLVLKSSLHVGTCLAVNANDKLDFFGTTINLAARMVECCRGCDLTVSDEFFHRPEMSDFLEATARNPSRAKSASGVSMSRTESGESRWGDGIGWELCLEGRPSSVLSATQPDSTLPE
jgi:class 3 adenylate cyclase